MPMSSWESVVDRICWQCKKNLATHWFGNTLLCCQCHGGDMFSPEEAVEAHLAIKKSREKQVQYGD